MVKRFVSIWFPQLKINWFVLHKPALKEQAFVLSLADHGKMKVTAANNKALQAGIVPGMAVADARALYAGIEVLDDKPAEAWIKLLTRMAEWCIRFSPVVAIDQPDGLVLDATGCTHLWGGDKAYLADICNRFNKKGYNLRISIAGTIGAAWAVARYGKQQLIIEKEQQASALISLPAEALRLEAETIERLYKLGLYTIAQFINMPRYTLQRRFGMHCVQRLQQTLGEEEEYLQPVLPLVEYQERLPCLEPIATATGIEIAVKKLLDVLCERLQREQKGLRKLCLQCYRVDGQIQKQEISTNSPSHHSAHLFKLFELKLQLLQPDLGFELFVLDASGIADHYAMQEKLWQGRGGLQDIRIAEWLDRVAMRVGIQNIRRYVPDEHYWPERSVKIAGSLNETIQTGWKTDKPRPVQLLPRPESIEVTAPIPDYPPMSFRYKNVLHTISKADGPERIEQEWWLQQGQHRDYYAVEDTEGHRYWIFRLGHYDETKKPQWFIHGFFA